MVTTKAEMTSHGNMHGLGFTLGAHGLAVASVLISLSLHHNQAWISGRRLLILIAQLPWIKSYRNARDHIDLTAAKWWQVWTRCNLDPNQSIEIEANLAGITTRSAVGETLTLSKVDSINTFDAPNAVVPRPVAAKVQSGKLVLKLEPKSVTVVSVEQ